MGKLMMANSTPIRLCWLAPWLDVMGTETDWNRGQKWRPTSDEELLFRLILLNLGIGLLAWMRAGPKASVIGGEGASEAKARLETLYKALHDGRDTGISYQRFKELYDAFNDTIREVGRKNQVMVIDLAREVPPDKKYLYDLVHFNDAGSQLAAGIIAARLKGIIVPQ